MYILILETGLGREIVDTQIHEGQEQEFITRLRDETKLLKSLFDHRSFCYTEEPCVGLELEAWLTNKNFLPLPKNQEFLNNLNLKEAVPELSKFNFELNGSPVKLGKKTFSKVNNELTQLWDFSQKTAQTMGANAVLIGILPLVREDMLKLEYMSNYKRYKALNDQLFKMRKGKDLEFNFKGVEELQFSQSNFMLEAAATSLQIHLQVNQENAKDFYNAALIGSAPLLAMSANSPFLYGKNLWAETRIPIFEQSLNMESFKDIHNKNVGRVSMGTGYMHHSFLEPFLENLDGFPAIMPFLFDEPRESLAHLNLQNGTVWRWVRPIIGSDAHNKYHLRIEQRILPAGPTLRDVIANMMFFVGLTYHLAKIKNLTDSFPFTHCESNFYDCAQFGLETNILWHKKKVNVQELLLHLLPKVKEELYLLGIDKTDVELYIDETIKPRILTGQTGAHWQRAFVDCHGKDFQKLTETYFKNQESGQAVHSWSI